MFKLRFGYLVSGIIIGSVLLFSFITSFPDGNLHIFFCDVGQGDAAYIKFPDGRDMVVDGGPDDKIISCLSNHMPFWDRTIDLVLLSHPEKDHLAGLISVFSRYHVGYFVRGDITKDSDVDRELEAVVHEKKVPEKFVTRGNQIYLGPVKLSVIWPSGAQIAMDHSKNILGASTDSVNQDCIVFMIRYGSFDAVFPGDADSQVENFYTGDQLADRSIEVLKVPHHGSKTGMTQAFIDWIRPRVAVISVGKNTFGHPSAEALTMLQKVGAVIHRTDKEGDIEVVSNGKGWTIK